VTHVVKEGETLDSIANQYGVTVNQLYRNNLSLGGSTFIYPGMQLIIQSDRTPIGDFMTGGYAYPYITIDLLNQTLPFMGALIPFTYGFQPDGTLIPLGDRSMIERANVYGTKPFMHLSTLTEGDVFSTELAEQLLNNRDVGVC
jgi:spore germination protein